MYWGTFNMRALTFSKIGAEFAPRLVAIGIAILSMVLLVQGLKKVKLFKELENSKVREEEDEKSAFEAEEETTSSLQKYLSVLKTIVLITLYIALMPVLGFIITTAVYLFIQIIFLAKKNQVNYVLFGSISVGVSLFVYYVFKYLLNLMLPAGILG